jgi:hypothetical protein
METPEKEEESEPDSSTTTALPSASNAVEDGALDRKLVVVDSELGSLRDALIAQGVNPKTARQLVSSCTPEVICAQLDQLPMRQAGDRAAVLVASIRENWGLPEPQARAPSPGTDGGSLQDWAAEEAAAIERLKEKGQWIR